MAGQVAGRFILYSAGIPYCTASYVLRQRTESRYVLDPDGCGVADDPRIEVRVLEDGRLRWELFYSKTQVGNPQIIGTLERKQKTKLSPAR